MSKIIEFRKAGYSCQTTEIHPPFAIRLSQCRAQRWLQSGQNKKQAKCWGNTEESGPPLSANTLLPLCPDGDCVCAISVYSKRLTLQFAVEVEGFPLPLHIIPISQKRSWVVFRSCHTKRMLPSPFFDPQSEWCRLSSKYLGEGSPKISRWAFVASQELLFVLYLWSRQTFSWQFQNSFPQEVDSFQAPKISNILQVPLSGVGVPLQLVQHSGATLLHCRVNGITSQPQDDKLIKLQYGKKTEAPGVENRSTEKQNEQWAHMQSSSFGSALNLCFLVQCHCLTANCATYGSAGVQWSHKNLSSSGVPPRPRREMVSTQDIWGFVPNTFFQPSEMWVCLKMVDINNGYFNAEIDDMCIYDI